MTEEQEDRALEERKSLLANAEYRDSQEFRDELSRDAAQDSELFRNEQKWIHEHDYKLVPVSERTDRLKFVCSMYKCECGDSYKM